MSYAMKRYSSALEVMSAHWGVPESDLMDSTIGGVDQRGIAVSDIPHTDILENVYEQGFWGFADTGNQVIHYWIDPIHASPSSIVNFFAHEITHLKRHAEGDDEVKCEREAMLIGEIAQDAYDLMHDAMGKERIK